MNPCLSLLIIPALLGSASLPLSFIENLSQTQIAQTSERQLIQQIVTAHLKQDSTQTPSVEKIAIADSYALAVWLLGEAGGMALLQKQQGQWKILTSGGGWLNTSALKEFNVPQSTAQSLLAQISPDWKNFEYP